MFYVKLKKTITWCYNLIKYNVFIYVYIYSYINYLSFTQEPILSR